MLVPLNMRLRLIKPSLTFACQILYECVFGSDPQTAIFTNGFCPNSSCIDKVQGDGHADDEDGMTMMV